MKPITKWPGGKSKEIKKFIEFMPEKCDRFIDPFVGGGSLIAYALENEICESVYYNDFSKDLYNLYDVVLNNFKKFSKCIHKIDTFRVRFDGVEVIPILGKNNEKEIIRKQFDTIPSFVDFEELYEEYSKYKKRRLNHLSRNKILDEESIIKAIETSFHGALYTCIRNNYNKREDNSVLQAMYFFYIRELCYSSMFRFNKLGDFNVPYGGYAYNSKLISSKIANMSIYNEKRNIQKVFNLDFEDFLNKVSPTERDFIFLDPPYDSEFSEYDQNIFDKSDQERLCNYLKLTKAKFIVVIKYTEFIYEIYNNSSFYIYNFEKQYSVNFKNRNERAVTHLIISNFEVQL